MLLKKKQIELMEEQKEEGYKFTVQKIVIAPLNLIKQRM